MVGVLLSLHLRQRVNRLTVLARDRRRLQGVVIVVLFLGYLAVKYGGGLVQSVSKTGSLPVADLLTSQLSISVVFLWVTFPLIYGVGRGLDVRMLQLLPLRPATIAAGIAAAFVLSPFLWLTAIVVSLLASTFPDTMDHLPLVALSVIAWTLLCAVTGQLVRTGVDLLARQRHARDFLLLLSTVIGAVPAVLFFVIRAQYTTSATNPESSAAMGLVPLAWPGMALAAAAQGRDAAALLALAGVIVLIALEVVAWVFVIRRAMLSEDGSTRRRAHGGDPFRGFVSRLPHDRRGAVAALDLRLLLREPQRLPGVLIGSVLFGGLMTYAGSEILAQTAGNAYATLGAVLVTVAIQQRRVNEIGRNAGELWMNLVAHGRGRDDILGHDLGNIVVDLPVVLVAVGALAIVHGDGSQMGAAVIFALAAVALTYAVVHATDVFVAQGQSRAKDGVSNMSRQGTASTVATMIGWVLGVAAVVGLMVLGIRNPGWMLPIAVLTLGGTLAVCLWSAGYVGDWLDRHGADLLARLQPA